MEKGVVGKEGETVVWDKTGKQGEICLLATPSITVVVICLCDSSFWGRHCVSAFTQFSCSNHLQPPD